MNRKSRSNRRSSILKIDATCNLDDETGFLDTRNRRSSKRVSFAEKSQVKLFAKDSPRRWDEDNGENNSAATSDSSGAVKSSGITGLDKLLNGAVQTPYQDVAECAIPEVSTESFNIFDINKTIHDPVDMDTTQSYGSDDILTSQMDFNSEPSMELNFDASKLLQSLKSKPSDSRLKTMQIYSPNRDHQMEKPDDTYPSVFSVTPASATAFTCHDKENTPLEVLCSVKPKQSSVDFWAMLQKNFTKSSDDHVKDVGSMNDDTEQMEETTCYDGVIFSGGNMSKNVENNVQTADKENVVSHYGHTVHTQEDATCYFGSEHTKFDIEETKCIGGILNSENNRTFSGFDGQENDVQAKSTGDVLKLEKIQHSAGDQVGMDMEETKCIGGILHKVQEENNPLVPATGIYNENSMSVTEKKGRVSFGLREIPVSSSDFIQKESAGDEVTKCFADMDADNGIEETKCIGGILSDEATIPLTAIMNEGADKSLNHSVCMEEATVAGGILTDLENQTVAMEETRPVGGILSKSTFQNAAGISSTGLNQTVAMEETKPLGGILNTFMNVDSPVKEIRDAEKVVNKNSNQTVAMEETKPVGGILGTRAVGAFQNETINEPATIEQAKSVASVFDKDVNQSVLMEETKPVGGILSKSVNQTVMMEETKLVGGIINTNVEQVVHAKEMTSVIGISSQPVNNAELMEAEIPGASMLNTSVNQTVAMEETRALGGILNSHVDQASSAVSSISADGGLCRSMNQTVAMEETNALGGILSQSVRQGVNIEEGISSEPINQTVTMEETKAVGGILNNSLTQNAPVTDIERTNGALSKTINQTLLMEETCVVGGILKDYLDNDIGDKSVIASNTVCNDVEQLDKSKLNCSSVNVSLQACAKDVSDKNVDTGIGYNDQDKHVVEEIDDEITFKVSNKRPFQKNSEEETEKKSEMTQDFTTSHTKLLSLKLKEMQKLTAAQIRVGEIKTPSKLSPNFANSSFNMSSRRKDTCSSKVELSMRSPLHKRQRISMEGEDDQGTDRVDPTAALLEGYDMECIDDEEMPDLMTTASVVYNVTAGSSHPCSVTTLDEPGAKTTYEEPLSAVTHNETGSVLTHNDRVTHNDTCSVVTHNDNNETGSVMTPDDTRSTSSDPASVSMMSMTSFVVPDGPLTVESFYALTKVKLFTLIRQNVRQSTIFVPKIDLEDLTEVLHTDLTVSPLVKAKQNAITVIQEHTSRLEEEKDALEVYLEETQPCIFQDCVKASPDELGVMKEHLGDVLKACKHSARANLCHLTTNMFTEALHHLQETGVMKAQCVMEELKRDLGTVDELLSSVDKDLEDLDITDRRLEDLEKTRECLEQEKKVLNEEKESERGLKEEEHQLKQLIKCHLLCSPWDLDALDTDAAVFLFSKHHLQLSIQFRDSCPEKLITHVQLGCHSATGKRYFEDHIAESFAVAGIQTETLVQKYPTVSQLPQLLNEVSRCIMEIEKYCSDVESVHLHRVLHFQNNELSFDVWDRELLDFITVKLKFDPSEPLTSPVEPRVLVKFGNIKSIDVERQLQSVTPGDQYLSRLIAAINFQHLHTS